MKFQIPFLCKVAQSMNLVVIVWFKNVWCQRTIHASISKQKQIGFIL